ncbi:MAG: DoxX family membrane protein [Ignavibacteriae bacterium]|nr:DoxX family membrane protein [Ignavibacteriota bacterium]
MRDFLSNKYLQFVLRFIIGGMFIYVAYNKLVNPEEFAKAIYNYKMLPFWVINIMAIILPYIELFSGIFLMLGIYKKGNSAIIAISLFIFIIALTTAYARGLNIDCGCGFSSLIQETASKNELVIRIFEDICMLIGIVIVYMFCDKKGAEPEEIKENQIIKGEI